MEPIVQSLQGGSIDNKSTRGEEQASLGNEVKSHWGHRSTRCFSVVIVCNRLARTSKTSDPYTL